MMMKIQRLVEEAIRSLRLHVSESYLSCSFYMGYDDGLTGELI